jgi:hypothetical protein
MYDLTSPGKIFRLIALISFIAILPFALIEYFLEYGNFLVVFFGVAYLAVVSIFEIKYGVFVFDFPSVDKLFRV